MPSDPKAFNSANLLGRDTKATMKSWDATVARVGVAPTIARGPLPGKSPENRRFRLPRYRGQLIGCCVGENTSSTIETLLRMPAGRTPDSRPAEGVALSPLWVYWLARKYSAARGMPIRGEGAIVSHAIEALSESSGDGVVRYDLWPATDDAYRKYSDRIRPSAEIQSEADAHPVKEKAILDSWSKCLEFLGEGFTLSIGIPIPQGIMETDDEGAFRLRGGIVGGHCMEWLDYDTDADLVWLGNSWANARWGAKSDDPVWQGPCQGYTNIGHCSMTDFEKVFSPAKMRGGESEAVVANNVVGWSSKLDWSQY